MFSSALWIEGWNERSLIGTNPFRILPSSLLKWERRIICTKRSKTPFWSRLCCQGNTLLCQSQKSTARMKGKVVLRDSGAQCFCTEQEKEISAQGHCGLRAISVQRWHGHTHLHANTGSRHWKWAPAQRRSWTCSATGGRCRTAEGSAPSCWINPTPSYVLSVRLRCSFCNRNRSQINHYCNRVIKSKILFV